MATNLQSIFARLSVNKVKIDIRPNDLNELSVFKSVQTKTDFDEFDDILTVFKGMKRQPPQPSLPIAPPPPPPLRMPPPLAAIPNNKDTLLCHLFQTFGYDESITLFMTGDVGHKLSKLTNEFVASLDKKVLKSLKLSEDDIKSRLATGEGMMDVITYMAHATQKNVAVKTKAWEFVTVSNDHDAFIELWMDGNIESSMSAGFMNFKLRVFKQSVENLKKMLVKDLKTIANHLNIQCTTSVDGKKVSLHKQDIVTAIETKLTST